MKPQRKFILGDEWLYFKIYTGYKTADQILTEVIYPLTQQLMATGKITHWFFIRYTDPEFHIRVRFFVTNQTYIASIINGIYSSLSPYLTNSEFDDEPNEDLIHKVQYDTYHREIERYGEKFIELSEKLFFHDSIMVIQLISILKGKEGDNQKWQLALRVVDDLLNSFEYILKEKQELLRILKDSYAREFNISDDFQRQLGRNYRINRVQIEYMLEMPYDINQEKSIVLFPIIQKKERVENLVKQILQDFDPINIKIEKNNLLISYIHMFINRIFRTNQREHELVLYDYLFRYYDAKTKRETDEEKKINRNK